MLLDSSLEFFDVALAERLHHVEKPLEVSTLQRVDNVLLEQLGDVENVLAKQDGHAHLDRQLTLLFFLNITGWRVCQVLEATFVVVLMIILSLVVQTIDMSKSCVNPRIDISLLPNLVFDL